MSLYLISEATCWRKTKLNYTQKQYFMWGNYSYQGLNRVDQLFCLNISSCGDRPDRKGDQTTRIENRWQGFERCNFEQKVCFILNWFLFQRLHFCFVSVSCMIFLKFWSLWILFWKLISFYLWNLIFKYSKFASKWWFSAFFDV